MKNGMTRTDSPCPMVKPMSIPRTDNDETPKKSNFEENSNMIKNDVIGNYEYQ